MTDRPHDPAAEFVDELRGLYGLLTPLDHDEDFPACHVFPLRPDDAGGKGFGLEAFGYLTDTVTPHAERLAGMAGDIYGAGVVPEEVELIRALDVATVALATLFSIGDAESSTADEEETVRALYRAVRDAYTGLVAVNAKEVRCESEEEAADGHPESEESTTDDTPATVTPVTPTEEDDGQDTEEPHINNLTFKLTADIEEIGGREGDFIVMKPHLSDKHAVRLVRRLERADLKWGMDPRTMLYGSDPYLSMEEALRYVHQALEERRRRLLEEAAHV